MATPLKRYQIEATEAIETSLTEGRPSVALDDPSRLNDPPRCVLLEAPTGSGKTLIAGRAMTLVSGVDRVVWFWIAPFAGVVGQAAESLRVENPSLRLRDIYADRDPEDLRPNDVYVMTWSSVAARETQRRLVRTRTESIPSLDELLSVARSGGFRIGLVVDEAHHGLMRATVATEFVRETLRPDHIVLITATPKDEDLERFRRDAGLPDVTRVSVSRQDAVGAGLIKPGVRAVAFAPPIGGLSVPVDFARTALRYAVDTHRATMKSLHQLGVSITPLLLVQVDSSEGSVDRARRTLEDFGIPASAIAVHTAEEPDPDLLAIASDENIEVLIFKMAVALGFDAPRAWTLVSMRSSKDLDFGVQVLGRILRVDRRLQGVDLTGSRLEYGYVFVADPDVQQGLISAADRINTLRTDIQRVAPDLQLVLVHVLAPGTEESDEASGDADRDDGWAGHARPSGLTQPSGVGSSGGILPNPTVVTAGVTVVEVSSDTVVDLFGEPVVGATTHTESTGSLGGPYSYALRSDITFPRQLKREQFPTNEHNIAECVADNIEFDAAALQALTRKGVSVVRRTVELFESGPNALSRDEVLGELAVSRLLEDGQTVLFEDDYVNGRSILPHLVSRLAEECRRAGLTDWLDGGEEKLEAGVLRILGTHPSLLRRALRSCLSKHVEVADATALPSEVRSLGPLARSRLNVYGVYPPSMNTWERAFCELLDDDTTNSVLWWHRNEPRKPFAVSVCAAGTRHDFYPDFVVGVKGRDNADSVLLVETKNWINTEDSIAKARSSHQAYGNIMMLTLSEEREWWIVRFDQDRNQVVRHQPFTVSRMQRF